MFPLQFNLGMIKKPLKQHVDHKTLSTETQGETIAILFLLLILPQK